MLKTQRSEYLSFRRKFEPASVKLVIIAESPPANGTYFYNPTGKVTEWLFAALMKQLGSKPTTKEDGLREFQRRGWVLVDATYEPVNDLDDRDADRVIIRDYHLLRDNLAALLPDRWSPIILMKANVCRLLEPKLAEDGFNNVLNHGRVVYFPNNGRQKDFQRQFSAILKSARSDAGKPRGKKRPANKIVNAVLTAGKDILEKSKDIFDYVKEHREEILEFFSKVAVAANREREKRTSDEMADMAGRTLHEAMQEVLADHEPRSASEIASEINSLGLYTRGDGQPVPASQISARANNYPNLFVRAGGMICLA